MASLHASIPSAPPVTFLSLPHELRQKVIRTAILEAQRRPWGLGPFYMAQDLRATHPDLCADVDLAWQYLTTDEQKRA